MHGDLTQWSSCREDPDECQTRGPVRAASTGTLALGAASALGCRGASQAETETSLAADVVYMALDGQARGPAAALTATERYIVEQSGIINVDSDVVVRSHHGADNGSARKFIKTVTPSHVIFSAGHAHKTSACHDDAVMRQCRRGVGQHVQD